MTSVIYQEFQEQYKEQRQEKDEFTNLSEDGKKTRIYNNIALYSAEVK